MYGRYPSLLPAMLIVGGASLWGLLWLPLRLTEAGGLAGPWVVVATFIFPAVAVTPLVWLNRRSLRGYGLTVLLFGIFSGAGFAFYTLGLIYTTVVRATLLFYLTPVWSAIAAWILLKETTHWRGWLAALVGFIGLGFIVGAGGTSVTTINLGDGFALVSGLCWAIGVIVLRHRPETPPLFSVSSQYLFATIIALIFAMLVAGGQSEGLADMSSSVGWSQIWNWLSNTAVLGIFSTLVLLPSLFGVFWAAGRLPPSRVGVLMMSEVLVAIVTASLLTDERMTLIEWVGASLIIAAAVIEVTATDENTPERT
ncbi:MAG: hypothetical protein DHS20C01_29360 [marine bacterium B5-7]|nr:MAG: hypothetical protein DHS20C01_29360 [marine bacterium B5-7]